jgi:iron complex transport system substrate-binding protein
VLFLHGLARLPAAGDGTAADAIIGYAGATNPFDGVNGYKAASEEALLTMAPDTILMLGDGNGGPTPEEVFAVPALRNTPAAANRSLLVLDGPYMLGFGPRTAGAIRDLALALYPEYLAAGE